MNRRTIKKIPYYPTPLELYERLERAEGWHYRTNQDWYHLRDKALVSILYLLALRVSEALRLTKGQFIEKEEDKRIVVRSIELAKATRKGKPRRELYRVEGYLPLEGERVCFTNIVQRYLATLGENERLFVFGNSRAL
jgi:integrase